MADRPRKEPRLVAGADGGSDSIAFEREDRPVRERSGRLRWLWLVLALLGVTGAAVAAGWFALGFLTKRQDDGIARIYAPEGPVKVRPQQPGGMAVPDRDRTVYGRIDGTPPQPVERLLPGAEQPLPRPLPAPATAVVPQPAMPLPLAPPTLRDEPGPARPQPQAQPQPQLQAPSARAAADIPSARPSTVPSGGPPAQGGQAAGAVASAPPASVGPAAAVPAQGGRYMVQLAAVREEQLVDAETRRLLRAHGDLLGNLTPSVVRADLGDKGIYYRLRMGPLADDAAAKALCAELEKRKAPCLVVRP